MRTKTAVWLAFLILAAPAAGIPAEIRLAMGIQPPESSDGGTKADSSNSASVGVSASPGTSLGSGVGVGAGIGAATPVGGAPSDPSAAYPVAPNRTGFNANDGATGSQVPPGGFFIGEQRVPAHAPAGSEQ